MLYFEKGSPNYAFSSDELKAVLFATLDKLGPKKKVLAIPPDFTRYHSRAGELTQYVYEYYGSALTDILPALGTHFPMTEEEIKKMFPSVPVSLFRVHNWRDDVVTVGIVPSEFVKEVSEGAVDYPVPMQVNRMLLDGGYDLILSLGQVVPHEVIGMANYNKNIFVGVGGAECINKSHFIGAVYGMERIMGRALGPVRKVLNYASEHFTKNLSIVYLQTVISEGNDGLQMRGLYIGDDFECFEKAAKLSLDTNFRMMDREMKKVVVFLDPEEFRSTWLGNKSIYRTRMAIADKGELIVLAPGLHQFGEDPTIDVLIRKYGYVHTPQVLELVKENEDLKNNLSVAAHLIHGTSEGRFSITYCPGHLTKEEVESVGFQYADLNEMMKKYNPSVLKDGWNEVEGEEIYYISNPALGLWAYRERFK
ncbi:MAG: lactate racemase domain-containing protein [Bacteroidales bacterium]|nr:lactate racemase domain-containing protein [Bacteroidales bacterium]MCL2133308.1 lactate racemase domain-containing protein [Bacteroidales bacterium]